MMSLLADSRLLRPDILIATALLAGVLLLGAFALYFIDRWKKKAILSEDIKAVDELTTFRDMFERGELTEEEYDKVRLRAAERMKKQLGLESPATSHAQPSGPATPPPAE